MKRKKKNGDVKQNSMEYRLKQRYIFNFNFEYELPLIIRDNEYRKRATIRN